MFSKNLRVQEQLWSLNKTYEDSLRLLEETNAVVEMHKYGAMLDFVAIDTAHVSFTFIIFYLSGLMLSRNQQIEGIFIFACITKKEYQKKKKKLIIQNFWSILLLVTTTS